jgi:cytoskeletal protein CcmA (bactofilin family)
MDNQQLFEGSSLNSIIGEGTKFKGEFDIEGLLRIDGDFSGTIRSKGKILVGLNGRAQCDIYAETIIIGGIVRGNILATGKIIILSTGMVLGNISTPCLVIEEGVIFNGQCRISHLKSLKSEEKVKYLEENLKKHVTYPAYNKEINNYTIPKDDPLHQSVTAAVYLNK